MSNHFLRQNLKSMIWSGGAGEIKFLVHTLTRLHDAFMLFARQ
jgi:hypothetical protein